MPINSHGKWHSKTLFKVLIAETQRGKEENGADEGI